ncbi:MAG: hypothetical protein ACYTA3_01215 [Planctomycetota bacterium]|jgi:hypothetical protein
MEIEIGPPLFVFIAVIAITVAWVVNVLRTPKPVFDRERRELRYGRDAPIPFRELEVRVFRYRREEDPDTKMGGPIWSDLAAGTEEIYRVYVRAGDRRVDLLEFPSAEEAERYADEIRAMIAEDGPGFQRDYLSPHS